MTYRGLVIGRQESPTQKSNGATVAEIGVMWSQKPRNVGISRNWKSKVRILSRASRRNGALLTPGFSPGDPFQSSDLHNKLSDHQCVLFKSLN